MQLDRVTPRPGLFDGGNSGNVTAFVCDEDIFLLSSMVDVKHIPRSTVCLVRVFVR